MTGESLDMPHKTEAMPARRQAFKVERARRYLTGAGVTREDSDDELGFEDLPWEWIYKSAVEDKESAADDTARDDEDAATGLNSKFRSRKRKASHDRLKASNEEIIGAKMGTFECKVGDCVLLKAEGNNEAWVGLICEFMDDVDGGKVANFMWFSTEKEIRNKEKKRKDFMQVLQNFAEFKDMPFANFFRTSFT